MVDNNSNTVYGALYTWASAMKGQTTSSSSPSNVQGVCPTGWHLPSDAEWITLINQVGGSSGAKLAGNAALWTNSNAIDGNANFATTGFNGLPAGKRSDANGYFISQSQVTAWWTSTQSNGTNSLTRGIYYQNPSVYSQAEKKSNGFSVRCVKN